MSAITIQVPDELAGLLLKHEAELPEILERAVRTLEGEAPVFDAGQYESSTEILEFLAELPSAEEILKLKASERLQKRASALLEKNRNEGLSEAEECEMDCYERIQHVVGLAKVRAAAKLGLGSATSRHA